MTNSKYGALIVAVGTAVGSILLQLGVDSSKWLPAVLSAVAVIAGILAPAPQIRRKNVGNPGS